MALLCSPWLKICSFPTPSCLGPGLGYIPQWVPCFGQLLWFKGGGGGGKRLPLDSAAEGYWGTASLPGEQILSTLEKKKRLLSLK